MTERVSTSKIKLLEEQNAQWKNLANKEQASISDLNSKVMGLSKTIDDKDKDIKQLNTKLTEAETEKPKINENQTKEKLKRTLDLINDKLEILQNMDMQTNTKRTGKSIAEDLHSLEKVSKADLENYRKQQQDLVKLEREAADLMLTLKQHQPEGLNDLSATDISKTWNMDMNSFLAILFELTRRHYDAKLAKLGQVEAQLKQSNTDITQQRHAQGNLNSTVKMLNSSLSTTKQRLTAIAKEKDSIGTVLADRYKKEFTKHLERYQEQFKKASKTKEAAIDQFKQALKEDNKTILRLSGTVSNVWGKYKDLHEGLDTLKKDLHSKEIVLQKVYDMFYSHRKNLADQQDVEKSSLKKEIQDLQNKNSKLTQSLEINSLEKKQKDSEKLQDKEKNTSMLNLVQQLKYQLESGNKRETELNNRFNNERSELMKSWDTAEKRTKDVSEGNVKLKALVEAVREKVSLLEKENKTVWETMGRRERVMQDTIEKWRNGKWIQPGEGISDVLSGIGYDHSEETKHEVVKPPKPEEKKEYVGKERNDLNADNKAAEDDHITYQKRGFKSAKYDERAVFNRRNYRFKQNDDDQNDDVIV